MVLLLGAGGRRSSGAYLFSALSGLENAHARGDRLSRQIPRP